LPARAGPARQPDPSIDHEDAPVVSVVHPVDREGTEWPEVLDATSRLHHRLTVLARHVEGPDGIEEDVDPYPCATPLREGLGNVQRRRAFLEDVVGVVDRFRRATDGGDLGGEDVVAVQQDLDLIGAHHRNAGIADQRGCERWLLDLQRRQTQVWWNLTAS